MEGKVWFFASKKCDYLVMFVLFHTSLIHIDTGAATFAQSEHAWFILWIYEPEYAPCDDNFA
jgi:hypothetical protein